MGGAFLPHVPSTPLEAAFVCQLRAEVLNGILVTPNLHLLACSTLGWFRSAWCRPVSSHRLQSQDLSSSTPPCSSRYLAPFRVRQHGCNECCRRLAPTASAEAY